jgi:hypothetical protein
VLYLDVQDAEVEGLDLIINQAYINVLATWKILILLDARNNFQLLKLLEMSGKMKTNEFEIEYKI